MSLRINPAIAKTIAFIPSTLPINRSNNKPISIPIDAPYILPIYIPTNNERIINKFGFTPSILNQLKKFDCKKYIKINVMNIIIIDSSFFIVAPLFYFITIVHYFSQFFKEIYTEIRILREMNYCLFEEIVIYFIKYCNNNAEITPIKYNDNIIFIFSF